MTDARSWHLPANAAVHGATLDRALAVNLSIFVGLLLLAHVLLLVGFLRRRNSEHQPLAHAGWRAEWLPIAAFAALFFGLALWSQKIWARARYRGADPGAMQVEAVGMQFAWYFRYPGADGTYGQTRAELIEPGEGNPLGLNHADSNAADDVVRGELVLPAGREVDLRIRALDVMHALAIPELRIKQNAIPGSTFHVHFTPAVPGTYSLLCTQVCGLGHARMQAAVRVLPAPEFDAWMARQESLLKQTAVQR